VRTVADILDYVDETAEFHVLAAAAAALNIRQDEFDAVLAAARSLDAANAATAKAEGELARFVAFTAADATWQSRALAAEAELRHMRREQVHAAIRNILPTDAELTAVRCALRAAQKVGALESGMEWWERVEAAVAYRDSRLPCSVCAGTGEDRRTVIDTNPPMYGSCSACRGTGAKVKP